MSKGRPRILVFASGEKDGGGSGFEKLVKMSRLGYLRAEIVGVVSNYENGGVREKADRLGIPFEFFDKKSLTSGLEKDSDDYKAAEEAKYQRLFQKYDEPWVCLSGWLLFVRGLPTNKVINIHPGPLTFGGKDMHGDAVHRAVMAVFYAGEIKNSAVSLHFAPPDKPYDSGPLIAMIPIPINDNDTWESLKKRVNEAEHQWQWFIINLVVNGEISLEGDKVHVPYWYTLNRLVSQE